MGVPAALAEFETFTEQLLAEVQVTQVRMTGYAFGVGCVESQPNAGKYAQATEVGGAHPPLVEGMGRWACIAANDVPEHCEVLGDARRFHARNDDAHPSQTLYELVTHGAQRHALGQAAALRARRQLSSEVVTGQYATLSCALETRFRRAHPR